MTWKKRRKLRRSGTIRGVHTGQRTVGTVYGGRLLRPEERRRQKSKCYQAMQRVRDTVSWHSRGLQTAAIAVLTVTLVAESGYLWSRVLYPNSTPRGTIAHTAVRWLSSRSAGDSDAVESAAYPIKVAVRMQSGGVYGLQYSADGMQQVWQQTEDVWSAALTSARRLRTTTMDEYREALKNPMLFAEFDGSVPLSLIAGWLGAKTPQNGEDCACGGLLISQQGKDVYQLFVRDAEDGSVWNTSITLSDAEFSAMEASFTANDCTLAAETDTTISPDTLQFTEEQSFDTVTFQPYSGSMLTLLNAMGMDGQSAEETAYRTTDGTMVYVDADAVVRVTPESVMSYRAETGVRAYEENLHQADAQQRCAQMGRTISAALLEGMNSGGEAHLTKAYEDDQGRYVTVFALHIDGVPVDNALGYFARYVFEDGALVQANVVLRTCEVTGNVISVMPETVAAAARGDATALLSLRYTDTATLQTTKSVLDNYDSGSNTTGDVLEDDSQQTDTSWVDELTTESESSWIDSSGTDWSTDGTSSNTDASTATNGGVESTLNSTGTNVSAQAQWRFLLYQADETEQTQESVLPTRSAEERPPENPKDLDITWHMPDLLTPLAEGGMQP